MDFVTFEFGLEPTEFITIAVKVKFPLLKVEDIEGLTIL